MNNKIELANPINTREIKMCIIFSLVVIIIYIIFKFLINDFSEVDLLVSTFGGLLFFFILASHELFSKPKSIEIDEDRLILDFRFKSKPLRMRLEDIKSLTVSLDGSKIRGWIGFDAILIFKEKKPIEWFPLYWKSAIIIREHYKLRFGEYPPMKEMKT